MQSRAATVAQYLAELPPERRRELQAVRKVMRANLAQGFVEQMQYGMIGYVVPHQLFPAGYHCNPADPLCFAGLAAQKNYLSLYLMCLYTSAADLKAFDKAWAKTGKKLNRGKSCIRFQRADDLALDVIADAIRQVSVADYLERYEATLSKAKSRARKR